MHEYLERWPDRQDELRYCLGTILPEFRDSEFTWKDFQDKNNNELVAILGNFVQRVFVLSHSITKAGRLSRVPDALDRGCGAPCTPGGGGGPPCGPFPLQGSPGGRHERGPGRQQVPDRHRALEAQKTDPDRVRTVLSNRLNVTAVLSIVLEPFLPFTAAKVRGMLGIGGMDWDDVFRTDLIGGGAELGQPQHLFRPIAEEEIGPRSSACTPTCPRNR